MDEILTTLETEVHIDVPMGETIEVEPTVKDLETEVEAELTVEDIGSDVTEVIEIDMEESIGWSSGDGTNHHTLYGRDDPDQHIIESITGLREELDEIERLKPVCSDKFNIANYYKWKDAAYDKYGYFVSIVPGTSEIEFCNGSDIFGVSIAPKSSGFIGGENATVPRDNSYGLIVTSGLVDVRCELEINVGDYVVSNAFGYATKSGSNFGYKVLAIKDLADGYNDRHAVISLDVQADRVNALGENLQRVEEQVEVNYRNSINAADTAMQALNKVNEIGASNQIISGQVSDALNTVDKVASDVGNISVQVSNAASSAAQAQAVANRAANSAQTAVLSAENANKEALQKAQEAINGAIELRNEFALMDEQIIDVEDKVAMVVKQSNEHHTAIAGIQNKVSDEAAAIDDLVTWQGTANSAMARVEKKADANGAYIQSTVTNMDMHSVGPYSQAYGFTLEQAMSFIEDGMIYVPTVDKTGDNAEKYPRNSKAIEYPDNSADLDITQVYYVTDTDDADVITYYYWGYNENAKKYDWLVTDNFSNIYDSRSFLRGYLYKWGELQSGLHGWITVDKFYKDTDITNTSAPAVFFVTTYVPGVASGDTWGYWYTDGDTLTGTAANYQPKTLYKWAPYKQTDLNGDVVKDQEGNVVWVYDWYPVATLSGNSRTRAVSQIRQDANSIAFEVTNPRGSFAGMKAELTETSASVSSLADWKSGRDGGKAIIRQESNKNETKVVIAAITETDGELSDIASLELKVVKDEDGNPMSKLQLSAEDIQFTSSADYGGISLKADQITLDGESVVVTDSSDKTTKISGDKIATGTITADKIAADAITADKINVDELSAISANMGTVTAGTIQSLDYNLPIVVWNNDGSNIALKYTLNSDGTSYRISGIQSGIVRKLDIPSTYEGLPVTSIGGGAFKDCDSIKSVTIPSSITSIGGMAFQGCENLTSVTISNGVESIGNDAFFGCSSLIKVVIPDSVTIIGSNAFRYCSSLASVIIGNGATNIDHMTFADCYALANIVIPNNVTKIGNYAFQSCSSLTGIVMPNSIKNIENCAFRYCSHLSNVYYCGSETEWDNIIIGSENTNLTSAKRYYYSENAPEVEGNFWHYGGEANGFRISCNDDYLIDSKHFKVTPDGDMTATSGTFSGTVRASMVEGSTVEGSEIIGGSLFIGDKDANYAEIKNGILSASGADIDGVMTVREGYIGDLKVNQDGLWFSEVTNYSNKEDFLQATTPYYIYSTNSGWMFSNKEYTDKSCQLWSDYTYRFHGILENVSEIQFSGAFNWYDTALKGVGIWTIDKGIDEATFDKFYYARGDSIETLVVDTSDVVGPFYVGVFCSHEPDGDIRLAWNEVAVSVTKNGFEGRVIPRRSTSSNLRALYVDEYGRICVKP